MAELNRLFFALWPEDAVRGACAEAAREVKLRAQPGGQWVTVDMLHMTMLFLGDFVSAQQQEQLMAAAGRLRAAPFDLTLDTAGSFKTGKQIPYWLAPRNPPSALAALNQALREMAVGAGVELERTRFAPHLTILRGAPRVLPDTPVKPISWEIKDFVLARSPLGQRPAAYEVLGRWPLTGAPSAGSSDQLKLF